MMAALTQWKYRYNVAQAALSKATKMQSDLQRSEQVRMISIWGELTRQILTADKMYNQKLKTQYLLKIRGDTARFQKLHNVALSHYKRVIVRRLVFRSRARIESAALKTKYFGAWKMYHKLVALEKRHPQTVYNVKIMTRYFSMWRADTPSSLRRSSDMIPIPIKSSWNRWRNELSRVAHLNQMLSAHYVAQDKRTFITHFRQWRHYTLSRPYLRRRRARKLRTALLQWQIASEYQKIQSKLRLEQDRRVLHSKFESWVYKKALLDALRRQALTYSRSKQSQALYIWFSDWRGLTETYKSAVYHRSQHIIAQCIVKFRLVVKGILHRRYLAGYFHIRCLFARFKKRATFQRHSVVFRVTHNEQISDLTYKRKLVHDYFDKWFSKTSEFASIQHSSLHCLAIEETLISSPTEQETLQSNLKLHQLKKIRKWFVRWRTLLLYAVKLRRNYNGKGFCAIIYSS